MAAKMPDIEEDEIEQDEPIPDLTTLRRTTLNGNHKGLTQAYELRDLAADSAMALKGEKLKTLEDKSSHAQALRAYTYVWQEASERIRILKGKPMPGSLRPTKAEKPVRKPSTLPTELPE